jgi:hypothetical protein
MSTYDRILAAISPDSTIDREAHASLVTERVVEAKFVAACEAGLVPENVKRSTAWLPKPELRLPVTDLERAAVEMGWSA